MAASASDKWRKYKSRFSTTLSTGIGTGTSDTLTPATVTGLPTDTAVTLFIDRVDSTGTKTPTKLEAIKGVISGGNLTSYVRAVEGTEQAHTGGAVVEMVWNAADWNDAVDSFLTEHNQDGTHKSATVTTLKATAAEVATGTDDTKIVTPLGVAGGSVLSSGWTSAAETWTYASASTITVPSGAANKYSKGDKIRLKQGGGYKYFYVVGVADTLLTVTGGSDYTVANSAITDNYYSHQLSPIGFPNCFAWVPTLTGGNADLPSYTTAYFSIESRRCKIFFLAENKTLTGTAGDIQVTLPVNISLGGQYALGNYRYFMSEYAIGRCEPATSYVRLYKGMTTDQWAGNESGVYIILEAEYWI